MGSPAGPVTGDELAVIGRVLIVLTAGRVHGVSFFTPCQLSGGQHGSH
jgi:hypothetical protein